MEKKLFLLGFIITTLISVGCIGETKTADEYVNEGLDLFYQEKYVEAIEKFDKAIEINPNDADAWYNKGHSYGLLGLYEEALASFQRVIEINPNDADAWYYKCYALFELERYSEAESCIAILEFE